MHELPGVVFSPEGGCDAEIEGADLIPVGNLCLPPLDLEDRRKVIGHVLSDALEAADAA